MTATTACGSWQSVAANSAGLLGYLRTNWSKDPFAMGAYSYVAKGTSGRDYTRLERPVGGRLFFAGEATYHRFNSTVHAAFLSGQHVAKAVLAGGAKRVAVIGAGMSGLSAAHALSAKGREVTVFEARDRIGGRVWTNTEMGVPLDLGAAWIHGIKGNPLTGLADRLGIKRDLTEDGYAVRGGGGRKLGMFSTPGWLFDENEIQVAYGADKDWIDESGFVETDGFDGPDVSFPQGYAEIFEALKGGYAVKLDHELTGLSHDEGGTALTFANGSAHEFDAAIITVPLGVLKSGSIKFEPALPDAKLAAIEAIGFGLLDKVCLRFDTMFWDPDATWIGTPANDLPRGYFNQWFNLGRYIDEPVIVALNGGSAALALAEESDETLLEMAISTLTKAYPG